MAAEAATTFVGVASDGELAGQASVVDFGVQSSTELGAADLRPQDLFRSSSGGGGHGGDGNSASIEPGPVLSLSAEEVGSPSHQLDLLPSLGVEPVAGGVDPPAPVFPPPDGRRVVVAVRVDLHVSGGAMRFAAFLVMFIAAVSLTGVPDAPRHNQFRALMVWLGGCILLFLLRH